MRMLITLAPACMLVLGACSTADTRPLVEGPTSALAKPAVVLPESAGSLFPAFAGTGGGYLPLFEDKKARRMGDTLTIVLNERTSASRNSNALAQRQASANGGVNSATGLGSAVQSLAGIGVSGSGTLKSEGKGNSTAANDFAGTLTVTVIDVRPNGHFTVAGEKRVAISAEEEIIRFSGVVNPRDLVNNTVNSTQVADVRLEYRGRGAADDVQAPGLLMRALFKFFLF